MPLEFYSGVFIMSKYKSQNSFVKVVVGLDSGPGSRRASRIWVTGMGFIMPKFGLLYLWEGMRDEQKTCIQSSD